MLNKWHGKQENRNATWESVADFGIAFVVFAGIGILGITVHYAFPHESEIAIGVAVLATAYISRVIIQLMHVHMRLISVIVYSSIGLLSIVAGISMQHYSHDFSRLLIVLFVYAFIAATINFLSERVIAGCH